MKKQLLAASLAFPVLPISASPIIGAWVHNNGAANDSDTLVFLPNGIYFHAEDGSGASDTMQRGTFTWDEASSQLSLTPVTVAGASELPQSFSFPVVGDQAMGGEFQRVVSSSDPLVGGWSFGDTTGLDSGVVVFLGNGVYFHAEDVEADPPFLSAGMERGTYTFDSVSGAFSAVVTTDTNGEVGFSNPEGPPKISLLGDQLLYKPGFLSFLLSRVTVAPDTAVVDEAQSFMASEDGMYGVMVNTVPGFFYTVLRSSDLGVSDVSRGVEGDGTMSSMLLETDPATMPKAFFTTQVEVQKAIASADITSFLDGQSLEGITFLADGSWSSVSDSGLWFYEVLSAGTGTVQLTSNGNGNDPAQSRTEYAFDFGAGDGLETVATTVRSFTGETETEVRTLTANLEPVPVDELAPSVDEFFALVVGTTIKGINFLANNRWSAFGEGGNWSYEVSSPETAKLTIVFDSDSNDPLIARDDYFLTFTEAGGLAQVAARIEISDENTVEEVENSVVDFTGNTFAPTISAFTSLIEDQVINSTVFDEDGTFVFNGNESGRWTAVSVGVDQIRLTQTYDEDGNDPQIYREESLLTFDGISTVALNYREFDAGQLDFEVNTTVTFD